jgi:hypothetical protein
MAVWVASGVQLREAPAIRPGWERWRQPLPLPGGLSLALFTVRPPGG